MDDSISGWNDWTDAFVDWTDVSISELHGLMTGLMTVCHAPAKVEDWQRLLTELSFAIPDEAAMMLLAQEAEDTAFQLKDRDDAYQYNPLVPDDEHDLYERLMGLKEWANGFMTGFGVTNCALSSDENAMLADLSKIGSIRLDPDDEFEGGEEHYLQLYEFARMVPVSLATRPRKSILELPLIAGLAVDAKTAAELKALGTQTATTQNLITKDRALNSLPSVLNVMNQDNPS